MNKGIPTNYNGINFRSRLEAKWAVMLDLLGWTWEYEPFDLPGWIPDFQIIGDKETLLVEIKPFFFEEEWVDELEKITQAMDAKRDLSSDVLLLGTRPIYYHSENDGYDEYPAIGFLCENGGYDPDKQKICLSDGYGLLCDAGKKAGLFHNYMSYHDRITGAYTGNAPYYEFPAYRVQELWANATNEVQWKKVVVK